MKKDTRITHFDDKLGIEAYSLEGIVQPFPNHLHEYYVIGYMVSGQRYLVCRNNEYILSEGQMVLFNPGDNHGCDQSGNRPLHYLGINISKQIMQNLVKEITENDIIPYFSPSVIWDMEVAEYFKLLHKNIMNDSVDFENEELLFFMIEKLLNSYHSFFEIEEKEVSNEIQILCDYIEKNYAQTILLEELCHLAGISKSSLLRNFTKVKGMTPYRYLQSVRIGESRKLLEKGNSILDTAIMVGFSDQSHFSRFFNQFIGLTPGTYRDIFIKKNERQ